MLIYFSVLMVEEHVEVSENLGKSVLTFYHVDPITQFGLLNLIALQNFSGIN